MVEFYLLTFPRFPLRKKEHKSYFGKNRTHDFRTSRCAADLSNANPACGHKEVRRSTGHIMVTTRYSDQQGSKSRQKVMRLYKQWHRPISKRSIKPPYSISRATSIDSECCRLPTTNVLSNKPEKIRKNYAPTSFDQQVQDSQGHALYRNKKK